MCYFALVPPKPRFLSAYIQSKYSCSVRSEKCSSVRKFAAVFILLLLPSGDVELNPEPVSTADQGQLSKIESLLIVSQRSQGDVLAKLSILECRHAEVERMIDALITKSDIVERRVTDIEKKTFCTLGSRPG